MDNKLKVGFLFFCALISIALSGCMQNSIKFNRESKVQDMMSELGIKQDKSKAYSSSGVVIYKTNQDDNKQVGNMNFGPKDLDFDLHIKF